MAPVHCMLPPGRALSLSTERTDFGPGRACARMMAEARNNAHREVLGDNARIAACPACGQRSAKADNNNHMRCWACNVRLPAEQFL